MKNIFGFLVLFLGLSFGSWAPSEFYSSLTKIDYLEESKTLKFTTKLNSDHLAGLLKTNANSEAFEIEVKKYLNNHFEVYINGQKASLTFTGVHVDGEASWVYFEVNKVDKISSLKIKNILLLEAYPKQLNMVSISYRGIQKNMTFLRGKEINELSF